MIQVNKITSLDPLELQLDRRMRWDLATAARAAYR